MFHLTYDTAKAGGGVLPARARTEIATPSRLYPAGYRVSVSGATVVSAPGAPVLELVNKPGRASVEVTVTP